MPSAPRQRRLDSARMGARVAVRHKPHGVLAVLGPLQFPGAPAQRPHRPGADRRQRRGLQAEREDAGGRRVPGRLLYHEAGVPEGVVQLLIRAGPRTARRWPRSRASTACCSPARRAPASRSTASSPTTPDKILALEMGGNNPLVVLGRPRICTPRRRWSVQSAYHQRRPALHRGAAADRARRHARRADRRASTAWPTG